MKKQYLLILFTMWNIINLNAQETFIAESIPESIKKQITGKSWVPNELIQLEDLRYLSISFLGFDNKLHVGHMIVNKDIAQEVLQIFKELFDQKFQIEKMQLIDNYFKEGLPLNEIDNLSVDDNNTYCFFFYRTVDPSKFISEHSTGMAIDINPRVNPWLSSYMCPKDAQNYLDREQKNIKGFINTESSCYTIFQKYGWVWGGDWRNVKDYHHFSKNGRCPQWFVDTSVEPEWIKAKVEIPDSLKKEIQNS